jgi:uncharacterized protein (TIGR02246 family)
MGVRDPSENHERFERAVNAGDADALAALYEPGAVYVAGPGQQVIGRDAIRSALAAWLATKPRLRLALVGLATSGDVALERTRWTVVMPGPDGRPVESSGASSVVLRRQGDGTWLMAVDDPGLG